MRHGWVIFLMAGWFSIDAPFTVAAPPVLTLEEVYQRALDEGEQVKIAEERLFQAERGIERARSFLLPRVTLTGEYTRRPEALFGGSTGSALLRPEEELFLGISVVQPLYSGGRATAELQIARRERERGREGLRLAKEDLLFNVAQAYYAVLNAQKDVALEEEEVKRLEQHKRDAVARVKVGEATKTVVLRAQAELSGVQARLIEARNALRIAKDRLALLAKLPEDFTLSDPPSPAVIVPVSPEGLIEQARQNRADLIQSRMAYEIADQRVRFVRGAFLPTLSLEGEYILQDQSPQSFFFVEDDGFALLTLSLPLFEGGRTLAELRQALSQLRQADLERRLLEEQVEVEVRQAIRDVESLEARIEHLTAQVASARENFTLVSRQFAVGLVTSLDSLDASAILIDAERQLARARFDRDLALLRLQKSVGLFLKNIRTSSQ